MGSQSAGAAAVDCGTNSTRLLVVDGAGRPVVRLMRITRLGAGVDATRRLDDAAVARTLDALAEFRKEMDAAGVAKARQVATSAVRDAANGEAFRKAATAVTRVPTELLSGDEEGRLAFSGACRDLDPVAGSDVVVDIGGGSTELVVGHGGRVEAVSLDIGCVRVTERFLRHDPPLPGELAAADAEVARHLDGAARAVPALGALPPSSRLIGLAGTVSTLRTLDLGLEHYDWARVHHGVLTVASVEGWRARLAGLPASDRARLAGMAPGREDVIVGGVVILASVLRHLAFAECLVSEADILDGLVATLLPARAGD